MQIIKIIQIKKLFEGLSQSQEKRKKTHKNQEKMEVFEKKSANLI